MRVAPVMIAIRLDASRGSLEHGSSGIFEFEEELDQKVYSTYKLMAYT